MSNMNKFSIGQLVYCVKTSSADIIGPVPIVAFSRPGLGWEIEEAYVRLLDGSNLCARITAIFTLYALAVAYAEEIQRFLNRDRYTYLHYSYTTGFTSWLDTDSTTSI